MLLATLGLAAVSAAAPTHGAVHYSLRLYANGEAFVQLPVGRKVYISAKLHPPLRRDEPIHIVIRARRANLTKSITIQECGWYTTLQHGGDICSDTYRGSQPVKYYFQAFLIDMHGARDRTIAKSAVVTVNWVGASIQPREATIEAAGAVRGEDLDTGALTCKGAGYSQGTSCFVNVPEGAAVTLKATMDRPPLETWKWKIEWELSVGHDQVFACPQDAKICTKTVTVPMLPAPSPIASAHIDTPHGSTGPSIYVVPCRPGDPPTGHPCTS